MKPDRKTLITAATGAVLFSVAVGVFWYLRRYTDHASRIEILALFGLGVVLAIASGIVVASRLRREFGFRRGIVIAALLGLAGYFISLTVMRLASGNGIQLLPLQDAAVLAAGAFLLAANSYLVGFLLLSPGSPYTGRISRISVIVLLYGSIPLGVVHGMRADVFIPRGPTRIDEVRKTLVTGYDSRQVRGMLSQDPPAFQFLTLTDGKLRLKRVSGSTLRLPVRWNTVVQGREPKIDLGGQTIAVVDHGLVPPEGFEDRQERTGPDRLEPPFIPGEKRSQFTGLRDECECQYAFSLDFPVALHAKVIDACLLSMEPLTRLDTSTRILPLGADGRDSERIVFLCLPRRYWPESPQLRMIIWWGNPEVHTLPADPGGFVETAHNRFTVLRVLDGAYTVNSVDNEIDLVPVNEDSSTGLTTVVFHMEREQPSDTFRFRVLASSGIPVEVQAQGYRGAIWVCRFPVPSDEIRGIQVETTPRFSVLAIRLDELRGFPSANRGCEDLLNMHVPYLHVRESQTVEQFLQKVFGERLRHGGGIIPRPIERSFENVTIRELFDIYYPNQWYANHSLHGGILIGGRHPSGLLGKAACALGFLDRAPLDRRLFKTLGSTESSMPGNHR